MKGKNLILIATLAFFASCSNGQKELPKDPKDKEVYVDRSGNSWIWNAMMMRWALSPVGGGSSYYYYPATGNYTTPAGAKVTPPSNVSNGISEGIKARSTHSSHSKGHAVFGGTGRSHSVSA